MWDRVKDVNMYVFVFLHLIKVYLDVFKKVLYIRVTQGASDLPAVKDFAASKSGNS